MIKAVHQFGAGERIELKIDSDPANLRQVRTSIEEFARGAGLSQEASDEVGLVINEALANVIRHGYGGATDRPIEVTAAAETDGVRFTIRDWGKPFDPALVAKRKTGELKPGGLGLVCIKKLMDEASFSRLPDGMQLTMVKRLAPNR
jgi:anti-sigma regulatory factor (Ser/Thr protein kinase)